MKHESWPLRDVTLKVLNLSLQAEFYQDFGLRLLDRSDQQATLGVGDARLLLKRLTDGQPRPQRTAGLFHFALLLPDRTSLGAFLRFAMRKPWQLVGAADHLVSESLYFSDPEKNGIEVYADRPAESWLWNDGRISMATLPLDLRELARLSGPEWQGFPSGSRLGHLHLTVGDLDRSQGFYEKLGLQITLDWGAFRFLAWGSYHHNLAINLVEGRNAAPVSAKISGLESFSVERETPLPLVDPDGIQVSTRGESYRDSRRG
jgi:catechol 2,3-dioxygenase